MSGSLKKSAPAHGRRRSSAREDKGRIRLARPLAPGLKIINSNDPTFSDLAGVLTGVKPVTYTDCFPDQARRLAELCGKFGLEFLLAEKFLKAKGSHFRRDKKMLLIGRDRRKLEAAAKCWARDPAAWGYYLGYPACCVREYSAWLPAEHAPRTDLVRSTMLRTGASAQLDFKLNNVWNYFSRMDFSSRSDREAYAAFLEKNPGLDLASRHVISWHPCSYNCAKSLSKAETIYSFMSYYAPDYAELLRGMLARQVVFWDRFRYAVLNNGGRAPLVRSNLNEKLQDVICGCDRAARCRGGIRLSRKGKKVLIVPEGETFLLDFRSSGRPRPPEGLAPDITGGGKKHLPGV